MKTKVMLYFPHLNIVGGVENAMLKFCEKYYEKYDITIAFSADNSSMDMINLLSKYAKIERQSYRIETDVFIDCTTYPPDGHLVIAKKLILWQHCLPGLFGGTASILDNKEYMSQVDGIVCVSKYLQKLIKEKGYDSKIIYNDFDVEDIRKMSTAYKTKHYDYCYVGRISMEKGLDKIAKLAKERRSKKFVVVGNTTNSNGYLQYLLSTANVDLIDATQNPFPFMKNSKFVLVPSSFESWGRTITESLIIGTPVISTNFDTAYEQIEHGVNGYILDMNMSGFSMCEELKIEPLDFKSNWEDWEDIIGE